MSAAASIAPATVRMAVPQDEERLFAFVWNAYEEMPHAPKSETRVRDVVRAAVLGQTEDFLGALIMPPMFGLIDGPSGVEAAIGLHPEQWWYSDDYALRAFFFYVHPDFRNRSYGRDLNRFAIRFAEMSGMIYLATCYGEPKSAKHQLFGRHLRPVGTIFAAGNA